MNQLHNNLLKYLSVEITRPCLVVFASFWEIKHTQDKKLIELQRITFRITWFNEVYEWFAEFPLSHGFKSASIQLQVIMNTLVEVKS